MSWLSSIPIVGDFIDSIGNALDKNITSDAERLKLKAELTQLYIPVIIATIEAQKSHNELQVKLAESEYKSEHWLVWARRPILSILTFVNIPFAGVFGYMDMDMAIYLAMLVNGLDFSTRGIEKIVGKFKEKENI